jgi:hypothetical protein
MMRGSESELTLSSITTCSRDIAYRSIVKPCLKAAFHFNSPLCGSLT